GQQERRQRQRAGNQPDDDQCLERELAETATRPRRGRGDGVVAHLEVVERAGLGEVAEKSRSLLLQRRDGGVDVVGRRVEAQLRYPGNHLSALVANDDVKLIDATHRDLYSISRTSVQACGEQAKL